MKKVERIGDRLIGRGVISNDQLEFALKEQKRTGERLGTILRQLNLITEEDLARVLAETAGIEHLSIRNLSIDPNVVTPCLRPSRVNTRFSRSPRKTIPSLW